MKTKTIEDAAKELYPENRPTMFTQFVAGLERAAFKAGVEFAQRWISVEDELPNADEKTNGLSKVVIAKCEDLADEVSAYYNTINKDWRIYPIGLIIKVTHWRPIELK